MNKILKFFKTEDKDDLNYSNPVLVKADSIVAVDPFSGQQSDLLLSSGHKITVPVSSDVIHKMLEDVRGDYKVLTTPYDFNSLTVVHDYNGASVMKIKSFTKFYVKGDKIRLFQSGYTYTSEYNDLVYMWLSRSSLIEEQEPKEIYD